MCEQIFLFRCNSSREKLYQHLWNFSSHSCIFNKSICPAVMLAAENISNQCIKLFALVLWGQLCRFETMDSVSLHTVPSDAKRGKLFFAKKPSISEYYLDIPKRGFPHGVNPLRIIASLSVWHTIRTPLITCTLYTIMCKYSSTHLVWIKTIF